MYRLLHIPTLTYVLDSKSWISILNVHKTIDIKKITISKSLGSKNCGIIQFSNKKTIDSYFNLFNVYMIYDDGSGMIFLVGADRNTKPINRNEFMLERC